MKIWTTKDTKEYHHGGHGEIDKTKSNPCAPRVLRGAFVCACLFTPLNSALLSPVIYRLQS